MIGIYRITSPTNKVNIGQSWDIENRIKYYRTANCKNQLNIYRSIKKHGWDKHQFDILQELPEDITQEVLDELEIFCIEQYKDCGYTMLNIRGGGSHGKWSEETKRKMSESNKGKTRNNGYKHTAEARQNMKDAIQRKKDAGLYKGPATGRKMSQEQKNKLSVAHKGRKVSEETREKLREHSKTQPINLFAIKRMQETNTGKKRDPITLHKMKINNSKNPIAITNIKTGEILTFINQTEAAIKIQCNRVSILRALKKETNNIPIIDKKDIRNNYKIEYILDQV